MTAIRPSRLANTRLCDAATNVALARGVPGPILLPRRPVRRSRDNPAGAAAYSGKQEIYWVTPAFVGAASNILPSRLKNVRHESSVLAS